MFDQFLGEGELLLTRNLVGATRCIQNHIRWRQEGLDGEDPFKKWIICDYLFDYL